MDRAKEAKPDPTRCRSRIREVKKKAGGAGERAPALPALRPAGEESAHLDAGAAGIEQFVFGEARLGADRHGSEHHARTRFAAYAEQIQQLVAQKWRTGDVDPHMQNAPVVIATFDLMRDGTIRNLQILQAQRDFLAGFFGASARFWKQPVSADSAGLR